MALSPLRLEILRISKYKKRDIDWLRNGSRIERDLGRPIEELVKDACSARHALSVYFITSAGSLRKMKFIRHRDVISRSYYSMYHAARAVVYLAHQGDDHQEHDQLYKNLPDDFVDVANWKNELKDARLKRNEADYEVFSETMPSFRPISLSIFAKAKEFHVLCSEYLRRRGCRL